MTKIVPSRRPISFLGQALQATVGQLQQQPSANNNGGSTTGTDGSMKYRCSFDIKEENVDSKGNSTFTSVSRSISSRCSTEFLDSSSFQIGEERFPSSERREKTRSGHVGTNTRLSIDDRTVGDERSSSRE